MRFLIKSFLKSLSFSIYSLPRKVQLLLGDALGVVVFEIFRFKRKLCLAHLLIAFPEWSDQKRLRIARRAYRNLGRCIIEYAIVPYLTKDWVNKNCVIHGLDHYARAYAKDQGVMMLTLHLGNGDLVLAALSRVGFPVNLISKHFKSQWLNEIWFGLREKNGMKFIPEEKSSFQILRALKEKAVIVFVLDQFMGPPAGVKTEFFGRDTGTASGLAAFARRTKAPVVPGYTYRQADGRMAIIFEAAFDPIISDDIKKDVSQMTQAYTNKIEQIIRQHPDQWIWLHRRWKTFEVR